MPNEYDEDAAICGLCGEYLEDCEELSAQLRVEEGAEDE